MADESIVIDIVAQFQNNTGPGMSAMQADLDRALQEIARLRQQIQSLSGSTAHPTLSLVDHASSTLRSVTSGLRSFAGRTWRAGVRIVDYATRPLRAIKNMLFSIKTLAVAVGGALAFKKGIMEPINLADQYSSAKIGFSTLLGDKKGQKMMDDLDKFAKETPFKTSNTISQAQKMIAMGWDAKNIVKDMTTIGDAAAATGKGDEGLNRIVLALAQIKSKGKLSTEELNQLAEAGISAKRYLAEGLGYGSGDSGIKKLSDDLQKGAIGSEAAIKALMEGMKEYEGMMNKTANETVDGLKSQIEDTFEINIARKWGQGLQDGAKKGLGSLVKLLDKSEKGLESLGDSLYDIGKQLSNWAAGKLESTIDKLMKLTETKEFKNASLFGKMKSAWDELISKPFGRWWDSSGKPYIEGKFKSFGKLLGEGLTNATLALGKGILSLLGVDTTGMEVFKEASDVGINFGKGFAEGFDGKKIMKTIKDVFIEGFKYLFNGRGGVLGNIIKTGLALKLTSGILSAISGLRGLWNGTGGATGSVLTGGGILNGIGLRGVIGSASAGTGLLGFGANQAIRMGAGNLVGGSSMGAGALSAIGLGATAGGIAGAAGLISAGNDYIASKTADNEWDKKRNKYRAGTKAAMVGGGAAAGAAAGAAIGALFGGITAVPGALIGAGIGGLGAIFGGNKVADSISGCKKSYAELNEELDELAKNDMDKRFGEWSFSADELSRSVKHIIGKDVINNVEKFNNSLDELDTIQQTLHDNKYTIDYSSAMIKGGGKLSKSDLSDYKTALKDYASATKDLLITNKKSTRSAFQLLYGDDTKGMANMTKDMEKTYSGLEKDLAKKTKKLNKVISDAFDDGKIDIDEQKKIDELVSQIEDIQDKVQERIEKVSKAEADASYDLIKQKYKFKELTPESFSTLIDELNNQNEIDLKGYDDAYIKAKAEIDVEFEEGTISEENYKKKLKEIEDKWRNGKAATIKSSVTVTLDVLKDNYGNEIEGLKNYISDDSNLKREARGMNSSTKFMYRNRQSIKWTDDSQKALDESHAKFLEDAGVTKEVQKQMKGFYNSLKPQEKDLKELKKSYQDAGEKVPNWIEDSLSDIQNIKIMSGDKNSYYEMIGKEMAKTDSSHAEKLLKKKGKLLPKALKKGIEEGLEEVKNTREKGLKSATVDVDTNLKVNASKKNIDFSDMDKKTTDVIKTLKEKGKITITKDGKVKIKTKNGKIDTSGLDKDTKKAVRELEKSGVIKIDKNGKITIKPKKVDTTKLDKSAKKAAKKLEKQGLIKINKKGKVTITKKGGINTKNLDKQTKKAVKALEKAGVLKIDKKGNVTVKAKKVDTTDVEEKSKSKTKKAVKGQKVTGSADVTMKEKSTDTSDTKSKAKSKTKDSVSGLSIEGSADITMKENSTDTSDPKSESKSKTTDAVTGLNVTGSVNVSMGLGSVSGIGDIVSNIKDKISNSIGSIDLSGGSKRQFANGGYVNGATLSLIGEDGPEMVIPLGAKRRNRGKYLLKQAADAMGIPAFANGGIVGGSSKLRQMMNTANNSSHSVSISDEPQRRTGGKIEVNVGGITIEISGGGNGVAADVESNTDRISNAIAEALSEAFQNIPLAT